MDGKKEVELVVYVTLRKCSRACEYFFPRYTYVGGQLVLSPKEGFWIMCIFVAYVYVWEKLELVVYVTLRKCSRACEYFSPRYAYVGGQLVLSP